MSQSTIDLNADQGEERYAKITDQALDSLRQLIGVPIIDTVEPWCYEATRDNIRHYAHGIGDDNPLWTDPDYAAGTSYGDVIAPPSFAFALSRILSGYVGGLPGVHAMWAGADLTWHQPVRRDTKVTASAHLKGLVEHQTRFAGRAFQQIYHVELSDQQTGAPLVSGDSWCFRTERDAARERGSKYAEQKAGGKTHYTDEDLRAVYDLYENEVIRGGEPRFYEDVEVGEQLPVMGKGPMTVTGFIAFAQGWGGLYIRANKLAYKLIRQHPGLGIKNELGIPDVPERVHWEDALATDVGTPAAYDYGPERCSWLTQHLTNWMGDAGFLARHQAQIRHHNVVGDNLRIFGTVTAKGLDEQRRPAVTIEQRAQNQHGHTSALGTGVVVLPSRMLCKYSAYYYRFGASLYPTREADMDFDLTPAQIELQQRAREAGLRWRGQHDSWDRDDVSPYAEITASLRDAGLLGLTIPVEYGGQGGTALDYVIVVEELFRSSRSWILGEPPFCTTGPGPSMILLAESEETRKKFLPDVVAGVTGCAIALTEPHHGSDLTELETVAEERGGEYVLTGSKRFITGAPENELYAVFARFDGIPGARGVGCVLIEKGTPGLELKRGARFVGSRGLPHGEVHMDGCRVPRVNVISGAGSFATLMTAFNMERLHNSIYSLAFAEAAFEETVAYCEQRQSFGKKIIEFQATYHALVDMYVAIQAHRLLTYQAAATAIDGRFPRPLESTVSKLSGATMLPDLTQKGLLLHGGDGATVDFPIQRLHRDAIAAMVAGGSPPVLRNTIAAQLFPSHRFRQK